MDGRVASEGVVRLSHASGTAYNGLSLVAAMDVVVELLIAGWRIFALSLERNYVRRHIACSRARKPTFCVALRNRIYPRTLSEMTVTAFFGHPHLSAFRGGLCD